MRRTQSEAASEDVAVDRNGRSSVVRDLSDMVSVGTLSDKE